MITLNELEVDERFTEWGIVNVDTGDVLECASEADAETQASLHPNAEVVARQVIVTGWIRG